MEVNDHNCGFQTATAQALGTVNPTANPTTAAQTATAQTFDFGGSPTPFEASSECPSGSFSPNNLDPEWAAACSPCLPATPTRTPGGFQSFGTLPPFVISSDFDVPEFSLETATEVPPTISYLPTDTPTNTPTITPTSDAWTLDFDFATGQHGWGIVYGSDGSGPRGQYSAGAFRAADESFPAGAPGARWLNMRYDFGHTVHVTRVTFYYDLTWGTDNQGLDDRQFTAQRVTPSAGVNILHWVASTSGVTGTSKMVSVNTTSSNWDGSVFGLTGVTDNRNGGSNTGVLAIYRVILEGTGGYPYTATPSPTYTPTLTPTATFSPTPTGTWATLTPLPSATQDRSFRPNADCRVPVYVQQQRIVDIDLGQNQSACYRLFPEIHLNNDVIVVVHIDVAPLDFCFDFYDLTVNFIGLQIDIAFFVSVGFAFLLVRFGLFSG